jgi:hypothetical protein
MGLMVRSSVPVRGLMVQHQTDMVPVMSCYVMLIQLQRLKLLPDRLVELHVMYATGERSYSLAAVRAERGCESLCVLDGPWAPHRGHHVVRTQAG